MNTERRKFLGAMSGCAAITAGLPLTATVLGAEAKPLTTTGIARTLLGLADRALLQDMQKAHDVLTHAASEILKGEPQVGKLASKGAKR